MGCVRLKSWWKTKGVVPRPSRPCDSQAAAGTPRSSWKRKRKALFAIARLTEPWHAIVNATNFSDAHTRMGVIINLDGVRNVARRGALFEQGQVLERLYPRLAPSAHEVWKIFVATCEKTPVLPRALDL